MSSNGLVLLVLFVFVFTGNYRYFTKDRHFYTTESVLYFILTDNLLLTNNKRTDMEYVIVFQRMGAAERFWRQISMIFITRGILEDTGLVDKPDAVERDSRQRRIDYGDRKKLFNIKRDARNLEKTRKLLRADKHFDSILDDTESFENEQQPMKADVKTVDFLINYKQRDLEIIRNTHTFSKNEAEVIRIIIAAGLYPQYAILDPVNKYQVICADWKLVLVDEFVEFSFGQILNCKDVLSLVTKIRKEMSTGLQRKLRGEEYHESELVGLIKQFAFLLSEGSSEISLVIFDLTH
ncbi:hypothetical protein DICVIV_01587 [Dictyocaulus viviparus]|uniref:Uncharacterized protein n=1 Tax=Dictyocaulus viviparus TaxID=29172 RepID=A0A0D8Y8G2_DICVI|nr:hypothetical protein DICVIV_01587 [Dictyocaulus viviparus]